MFKDRDKLYQVYHTMLSMVLTWALILAINEYYVLKVNVVLCAIMSLLLSILVYLFDENRKNTVTYLVLLSTLPIAGLIFFVKQKNPITWIKATADWIYHYDYTDELYVSSHAHFVLLGATLLACILFYLLTKWQTFKILLAVILFGSLILFSINEINLNKLVVGICVFFILTNLVELSGFLYNKKLGKEEKKAGILYLVPMCMLLAIISVGMPSKTEPLQWKNVKHIYQVIKDKIDNLVTEWEFFTGEGPGEFTVAFTGYSEDGGNLGSSNLAKDDKIALKVGGHRGNQPAYLIGSVSDTYTGYSWEKSRQDYLPEEEDYFLDYTELIYGLSRQDKDMLDKHRLVERRVMNLTYENIKTKTFFYPSKISWYEIYSKKTKKPNTKFSNITFPKAEGIGTNYQCIYYEMNLKAEEFQQMLRNADAFSYEESGYMNVEMLKWLENGFFYYDNVDTIMRQWDFYDKLKDRANRIQERYTQLPDTLPERVRELALTITKDADTTYDKLKAIEEYLNTYTYSLTPGKFPKGSDFVDYFLFDNKQGYCTSFATSMAVLARCIDVPTRYVEGFVVDYKDKIHLDYVVRNSKAHSWTEAYIEGFGWIPFEATPPYFDNRYVAWRGYDSTEKEGVTAAEYINPYDDIPTVPPQMGYAVGDINFEKDKELPGTFIGIIISVVTILILIFILLIYYIVLTYKYRKEFEKADYSRRMYLTFLRILKLLKKEGFTLDHHETILMLAVRVRDIFHFNKVIFRDVAEVFMRFRYAEEDITEKEYEKVEIFYQGLLDKKREETGRLQMHLEEFLFLVKKNNR